MGKKAQESESGEKDGGDGAQDGDDGASSGDSKATKAESKASKKTKAGQARSRLVQFSGKSLASPTYRPRVGDVVECVIVLAGASNRRMARDVTLIERAPTPPAPAPTTSTSRPVLKFERTSTVAELPHDLLRPPINHDGSAGFGSNRRTFTDEDRAQLLQERNKKE